MIEPLMFKTYFSGFLKKFLGDFLICSQYTYCLMKYIKIISVYAAKFFLEAVVLKLAVQTSRFLDLQLSNG